MVSAFGLDRGIKPRTGCRQFRYNAAVFVVKTDRIAYVRIDCRAHHHIAMGKFSAVARESTVG